jgi:hypothetical protein
MNLPISSSAKNLASNLLGSHGGGLSNKSKLPFGGLFGDKEKEKEKAKSESGKIAPQYATAKDAEIQLLNYEPMLLAKDDIDLLSTDWEDGATGSDITHIQNYVRGELMRREKNYGMHYPTERTGTNDRGTHASTEFGDKDLGIGSQGFLDDQYVDTIYRGPKTAWARFVSNATTQDNKIGLPIHEGFIMHGVESFDDNYGFSKDPSKTHKNVLGFDAQGNPHQVEEADFKHRPPPGVMNVKVEYSGIATGERKTTIEFVCWSRSQLDYLQPYFFTVGVTAIVEFGWNHFPREALIDLKNVGRPGKMYTGSPDVADGSSNYVLAKGRGGSLTESEAKLVNARRKNEGRKQNISAGADAEGKLISRPTGLVGLFNDGHVCHEKMKSGKGNYSFAIGMISNYSYSLRQDGGYDCSVELTSMAQVAKMMTNDATKAQNKKVQSADSEEPTKLSNFKKFIEEDLDDIVVDLAEGDSGTGTFGGNSRSINDLGVNSSEFLKKLRAYRHVYAPSEADKGNVYHAGDNEDKFISLYMLSVIINNFFSRKVKTKGDLYRLDIANSRCIAHPNIKSTDGNVLLIPNAVAPRRNRSKKFDGSTSTIFYGTMTANALAKNNTFGKTANAQLRLNEIYASTSKTGIATNMRDNLHSVITVVQKHKNVLYPSQPFPDFLPGTKGMSGRLRDLYINTTVIKDAVKNHKTIITMLDAILKKISTACCDIWDFRVVPLDSNTSNETKLTIRDMKFYGNKTVETIKRDNKAYIFRAHQKNSIVRGLDLDIQVPAELKSMVVYDRHDDAQVAFYQRSKNDRILKEVEGVKVIPGVVREETTEEDDEAEKTNKEYFIIPMKGTLAGYDIQCVDIDTARVKESMTSDMIPENAVKGYNQPIDGCEMTLTIDGIEGLRMLDAFNCTGIPTHWFMNGIWQITAIDHAVQNGDWETTVRAILRPNSNEK